MRKVTVQALSAAAMALVLGVTAVSAQQAKPARIRATIEKVDGNTLMVKDREGHDLKVVTADKVRVQGLAKASLADIQVDSYIGVTAMPEPDGSQKAIAIHIFMPSAAWGRRRVSAVGSAAAQHHDQRGGGLEGRGHATAMC